MKELNRERPMRAIHRKTGEITAVDTVDQSKALRIGGMTAYFDRYGNPKDDFCPWRVENVPTCIEAVMELGPISPDTITAAINERVKQYTAAVRRERIYMYKQVMRIVRLGQADFFFISHLGMDDQGYHEYLNGRVLPDVEIVQSVDAFNDNPADRARLPI